MGKVKDRLKDIPEAELATEKVEDDFTTYTLKDEEFNHLMNLNSVRNNVMNELTRSISSFLHDIIACGRLGYDLTDNLKFEVDFDDNTHQLKVWKIDPNLYKEE